MRTVLNTTLKGAAVCLLLQSVGAEAVKGDSLEATLYEAHWLLYQPIVLQVSLHLDEPFVPHAEDPHEAVRQLRRLRRRLVADIRQGETTIYRFPLSTPAFLATSRPTSDFHATVIGFLGQADERGQAFSHFEQTGSYVIVVRDLENRLEADSLPFAISEPAQENTTAAELFAESFPEALVAILEHNPEEKTVQCFERLALQFPETPYGEYAIVSLALMRYKTTFAEHNNKGGRKVWGPVAEALTEAAGVFEEWHPLHQKAWFHSALAQALAGNYTECLRTLDALTADFPAGQLRRKAEQLQAEVARKKRQRARDVRGDRPK